MGVDDQPDRPLRSLRHEFARAQGKLGHSGHPVDLVAVVLVDGECRDDERGRSITCYGALHVRMVDGDPAFSSHHVSTGRPADRLRILRRLADLCDGRNVVLGSPDAHETFWDRRHVLRAGVGFLDAMVGFKGNRPSDLSLVGTPEAAMIELASGFGLPNCYETDIMRQARCADVRAQLVWLAYVVSKAGRKEARELFAAFRAWKALENARPLPF